MRDSNATLRPSGDQLGLARNAFSLTRRTRSSRIFAIVDAAESRYILHLAPEIVWKPAS